VKNSQIQMYDGVDNCWRSTRKGGRGRQARKCRSVEVGRSGALRVGAGKGDILGNACASIVRVM
jgi:hypothetical protein